MENYSSLLVLTVVAIFFTQVVAQSEQQIQDMLKVVEKCQKQSGATEDSKLQFRVNDDTSSVVECDDVQDLLKTLTVPKTPEGKCMVACVLQEEGLMNEDRVDFKAINKFLDKNFPRVPEGIKKIAETILSNCKTSGSSEKDGCENAAAFLNCGKQILEEDFKSMLPSSPGNE